MLPRDTAIASASQHYRHYRHDGRLAWRPSRTGSNSRAARLIAAVLLTVPVGQVAVAADAQERLLHPAPGDWFLYGRNFEQQHFSPLDQIRRDNVKNLGLAWYVDVPTTDGLLASPVVADGVVYQSARFDTVFATDIRSGRVLWTFDPRVDRSLSVPVSWGARVNRGVALWEDKVYIGTGDCRLIAINRRSGQKVWDVQACDPQAQYTQRLLADIPRPYEPGVAPPPPAPSQGLLQP